MDKLPLYTLGSEKTLLVVGLGNLGKQYDGSRHNIGFAVLDEFADKNDFPGWINKKDQKAQIATQVMGGTRVILCKPQTFMNLSGQAVRAVQQFYKLANSQTLAVYDELAIPFGQIRTRLGGSDAGHNGVKSLIQHLGEDFGRLRIGVQGEHSAKADSADYVLAKFSKAEQGSLPAIIREANAILTEYVFSGQLPHDTRTVI